MNSRYNDIRGLPQHRYEDNSTSFWIFWSKPKEGLDILNELEISEDEYKQRCKTHDYLDVANCLIDYYLLNKHPDILLEYYKMQGYKESEQIFKNKINLYSMCKS
jgi:hypothetical protein